MSNDAEWDALSPDIGRSYDVEVSFKDQSIFWQGIAAQRLKYLKEAAKVMKDLMGNMMVDRKTADLAKEFIDAWGDDDE